MAEQINIEDYKVVRDAITEAENSMRPFMVPSDTEEIVVAGDVNETANTPHDFHVTFRVPVKAEDGTFKESYKTVEYKDVFITPRQDLKLVKVIGEILPFYKKISEDGGMENYNDEEVLALVMALPDELIDRVYNIVAEVCGIEDKLKPYIDFGSALTVVSEFFRILPRNSE